MAFWWYWWFTLILQQASQTFVSRARNSSSLGYHAAGAIFSNGVWFANQFVIVDQIVMARKSGSWPVIVGTSVYYITFCVIGSVLAHHFLASKVEKRLGIRTA